MWTVIWQHEWLTLQRNKAILTGLALLLATGLYALSYGTDFVRRQQIVLNDIDTTQVGNDRRQMIRLAVTDTTTTAAKREYRWVHNPFRNDLNAHKTVYQRPTAFAALSIGQKDNYPYYYEVWSLNNIYTDKIQEIRNPDKLQIGNFDLAFVLIYLFPLLIVAFGYDVLSAEHEQQTYDLLRLQASSVRTIVIQRLGFRLLATFTVAVILLLVGLAINHISVMEQWSGIVGWLLISSLYIMFWFTLVFAVVSFDRSSAVNAGVLVSAWVIVLLFIPSAIHRSVEKGSDQEKVHQLTVNRDDQEKLWNRPTAALIDSFHKVTPRYLSSRYTVNDSATLKLVAYNELAQRQRNAAGEQEEQQQWNTYVRILRVRCINPAYLAQHALNMIGQTELDQYLMFQSAVKSYQQQRRWYIFDYSLTKVPFGQREYRQFPQFRFAPHPTPLSSLLPDCGLLCLLLAGLLLVGYLQLNTGKAWGIRLTHKG